MSVGKGSISETSVSLASKYRVQEFNYARLKLKRKINNNLAITAVGGSDCTYPELGI